MKCYQLPINGGDFRSSRSICSAIKMLIEIAVQPFIFHLAPPLHQKTKQAADNSPSLSNLVTVAEATATAATLQSYRQL